jgi:hypothetical protein
VIYGVRKNSFQKDVQIPAIKNVTLRKGRALDTKDERESAGKFRNAPVANGLTTSKKMQTKIAF